MIYIGANVYHRVYILRSLQYVRDRIKFVVWLFVNAFVSILSIYAKYRKTALTRTSLTNSKAIFELLYMCHFACYHHQVPQ